MINGHRDFSFDLPEGPEIFLAQFMFFECDRKEHNETTTSLLKTEAEKITNNFQSISHAEKSSPYFESTQSGLKF